MVAGFHRKFNFGMNLKLEDQDGENDRELDVVGKDLLRLSKWLKVKAMNRQVDGDPRLYRIYHKLEELGELAIAFGHRDEIEAADALADLQYLLLGDCVTFDIPMKDIFAEVHRSNMTKTKEKDDPRMKDRSPESGYSPPDLKTAIEKGRSRNVR